MRASNDAACGTSFDKLRTNGRCRQSNARCPGLRGPNNLAVIARRGATKQSRPALVALDCFATLAMTVDLDGGGAYRAAAAKSGQFLAEIGRGLADVEPVGVHHLVPCRHEVRGRTSRARRTRRRPRPAREAPNASRRSGRRGWRSSSAAWSCDRGPGTGSSSSVAVHSVFMSSRLTKKSLVSVADLVGEHAVLRLDGVGAEHAQAADQHRHLGRGQRSSCALSISASSGAMKFESW